MSTSTSPPTRVDEFADLKGCTIRSIEGCCVGSEEVRIVTDDGTFRLFHLSDCCESVRLEEIHGDPNDLIDAYVDMAVESTNNDDKPYYACDSWTWTFYRLVTTKGTLVLRWLGESNGYYSESVAFERILTKRIVGL